MSRYVVVKKNPIFDWCSGYLGGEDNVPTKQEKYKPLEGYQGIIKGEDREDKILNNLYVRNPDKDVVQRFEKKFKEIISQDIDSSYPIKFPINVEVIISISIPKKRFYEVDVDNLAKTVLDCLNGIIIEDDSQVVNLLVQKDIHPFNIPGLMVALRKIKDKSESLFDAIKIYQYEYTDEKPDEAAGEGK